MALADDGRLQATSAGFRSEPGDFPAPGVLLLPSRPDLLNGTPSPVLIGFTISGTGGGVSVGGLAESGRFRQVFQALTQEIFPLPVLSPNV